MVNGKWGRSSELHPFSIYHFTFSMLYSVLDMEVIELSRGGEFLGFEIFDVLIHAVIDAVDDLFHLLRRAFHDKFDSAVGEVADVPEDIVGQRDVLDGVAKTDTLDSTGEMALQAMDGSGTTRRWS
jgi:hypothetical protein